MTELQKRGAIQAILFVAGEAVAVEEIARALDITVIEADALLEAMMQEQQERAFGIEIVRLDDKVQLRTAACYAEQVQQALNPVRERTLSASALETLSIIAYKQPITRTEIEAIKGVSADYTLRALLSRGLIRPAGRKDTIGRPTLYGTTDAFLRHFGISSVAELPPIQVASPAEQPV